MKQLVFVSYSWSGPEVGEISYSDFIKSLTTILEDSNFDVAIDRKELKYKDDIVKFEERLGRGDKIILIVSDKFLRSKNCMYEVLQIHELGNVYDRIFPIVLSDAKIYSPKDLISYVKHWQKEEQKLAKQIKTIDNQLNAHESYLQIESMKKFQAIMGNFLSILGKMNTLTAKDHLANGFDQLVKQLKDNKLEISKADEKTFSEGLIATRNIFSRTVELVSNEFKSQNIKDVALLDQLIYWQKVCIEQTFRIGVIAMVKSGKSSFLNSLLGDEILPMSNIPETSVPVRILHSSNEKPTLKIGGKMDRIGASSINLKLRELNEGNREVGTQNPKELLVEAAMVALEETKLSGIKFEILDTPGFGESLKQVSVGKTIDQANAELLERISVIIYVLDYTRLNTESEDEVLSRLFDIRPDILEKIQDRMFFVVNKMDSKDRNGLSKDQTTEFVLRVFSRLMPNINAKQIFHISAKNALLGRLILSDRANNEVKEDFGKSAFGAYASKVAPAEYKEFARKLLEESNLNLVESKLINFIYQERGKILIETLLENLQRLIDEFSNKYVLTAKGTMNRTIEEIEALEKKINVAKKKQEGIQEEANRFEIELQLWMSEEFKGFEKKIHGAIDSIFNEEKENIKTFWGGSTPPSWVVKFQKMAKSIRVVLEEDLDEGLRDRINVLNFELEIQLNHEFSAFKSELEKKIYDKQRELVGKLELFINNFAQEYESVIGKGLDITLKSIPLRLDVFDFEENRNSAYEIVDKFVSVQSRTKKVTKNKQVVVPGSWCGSDRMEMQPYTVDETVNVFSVSRSSLEVYWTKRVEGQNESASKVANRIIDSQIKEQIRNARRKIEEYTGDYLSIIHVQKSKIASGDRKLIDQRMKELSEMQVNVAAIRDGIIKIQQSLFT